uniref:Uncharacterized protein n=1 Tax=Anguilla anguilla TaxID=7936 RepID=A0A0E9WX96_ANGAN
MNTYIVITVTIKTSVYLQQIITINHPYYITLLMTIQEVLHICGFIKQYLTLTSEFLFLFRNHPIIPYS